jgi:hypothetical protein
MEKKMTGSTNLKNATSVLEATRKYFNDYGFNPRKDGEIRLIPPNKHVKNYRVIAGVTYAFSYNLPMNPEEWLERHLIKTVKIKGQRVSVISDNTTTHLVFHIKLIKTG